MTRAPRIAIVGGGVGGLAAALALQRRGAEIVVCEQSNALSDIGAGLHLSPNALMALRALGVEDAVIAIGSQSDFFDHPQLEERADHLAHAPGRIPPAIRRA
jgi:2-polyprenyl-6-methoxyphenol hydroxylase-like FAD-dependent oxidoreductase